jgi:cobalt/nickel transport system permease protein
MHHSFTDEFASLDSYLSRLPPRTKIISSLVMVILIALTPLKLKFAFLLYSLLIISLILLSKIPLLFFLKRLLTILPFMVLIVVSVPFIQKDGGVVFGSCLIKAVLIVTCLILLMQSTRFNHLLKALRGLKVPGLIITLLSFMYRYLFVLEDEILRKKRALNARSAGRRDWRLMKSTANMAGSLFIHTYERAERIYLAMCARGYKGSQE